MKVFSNKDKVVWCGVGLMEIPRVETAAARCSVGKATYRKVHQ